jgi:hypothetical protein
MTVAVVVDVAELRDVDQVDGAPARGGQVTYFVAAESAVDHRGIQANQNSPRFGNVKNGSIGCDGRTSPRSTAMT